MKLRYYCLITMVCFGLTGAAAARIDIEGVYVYAENDSETAVRCGIKGEAGVAAAESTLRSNRVKIISLSAITPSSITAYVSVTPVTLTSSACAAAISVQFKLAGAGLYGKKNVPIYKMLELCQRGGIISGPIYDLQTRINDVVKTYAEQCISEIEKIGD